MLVKVKQGLSLLKENSEKIFNPIRGFINFIKCIKDNKFEKMIKLMDVIEDVKVNNENDVMIEFKNSLVIKTSSRYLAADTMDFIQLKLYLVVLMLLLITYQ